jgi:putative transposase
MARTKRKLRIKHKWEISFAGGIYHITQRAPGREKLFIEDSDYIVFISTLQKASKKFSLDIFAFCCMPNHVHILLRTNENNLISSMKYVFERYAKRFNLKYQRKGHVFCGPFAAALCDSDDYFMTISLYIHLNPCAAGLNYDPWLYKWSSINAYHEHIKQTFINRSYLLSLIDQDHKKAARSYVEMLKTVRHIKIKKFVFDNKDCIAYKQRVIEALRRNEAFRSITSRLYGRLFGPRDISEIVPPAGRRLRDKALLEKRRYIIQQLKAEGYSLTDIAMKLQLHRQAVYAILNE